jgi:uncharacterized membrane protein
VAWTGMLYVYLLSLIPSFEGRYAVVAARGLGLSPGEALLASSLGVATLSLALPPLLSLLDPLIEGLSRSRHGLLRRLAGLYEKYLRAARERGRPYVERYGLLGLVLFVAIPLPGTGVWTGSLIAYILGLESRRSIPALLLGGLLSIAITFVPSYTALRG